MTALKVAIVRGGNLNPFEMQSYEPLMPEYDFTGYASFNNGYELDSIKFPVKRLHMPEEYFGGLPWPMNSFAYVAMLSRGWNYKMFGLEKELADKNILHAAETYNGFSYQCARVRRGTSKKMVLTVWENIPFQSLRSFRGLTGNGRVFHYIKENTDIFMAVTDRAKKALMIEGVPEEKVRTVPLGIDTSRFRPAGPGIRDRLGLNEKDFALLFVGRLAQEKGVYDLLYAMKLISMDPDMANVKAIMAGTGPEKENIVRLARSLGIESRVKLAGNFSYDEIPRLYNSADAFILPSIPVHFWQEQFGMVLLEAMAAGLPVISTMSGSIPEVVGDAGILIQPNDPLSVYEAVRRLASEGETRRLLGGMARARAVKKYNVGVVSRAIDAVYHELE